MKPFPDWNKPTLIILGLITSTLLDLIGKRLETKKLIREEMVLGNISNPQLDQLKQRFHNFTGAMKSCRDTNLFQCAVTRLPSPEVKICRKISTLRGKPEKLSRPIIVTVTTKCSDEERWLRDLILRLLLFRSSPFYLMP